MNTFKINTTSRDLLDHALQGTSIYAGAGYVTDLIRVLDVERLKLQNLQFKAPLILNDKSERVVEYHVDKRGFSARTIEGIELCQGLLAQSELRPSSTSRISELTGCDPVRSWSSTEIYDDFRICGNDYGHRYQSLESIDVFDEGRIGHGLARLVPDRPLDVILDGGIQALAQCIDRSSQPFVLSAIEQIELLSELVRAQFVYVERCSREGNSIKGDVIFIGAESEELARLKCIKLVLLDNDTLSPPQLLSKPYTISATFTAEPLEPALKFWERLQGNEAELTFTAYNQIIQQLIDPSSELAKNTSGDNLVLLRFCDWLRFRNESRSSADPSVDFEGDLHEFPGGLQIAHLNAYESNYLYKEIFIDRAYLRHGIELPEGAVVFDIGANVGLFTLFVKQQITDARIFAFEPSPEALNCLRANVRAYAPNTVVLEYGAGEKDGVANFTFYPNSSVFSSFAADEQTDATAIRAVIRNMLVQSGEYESALVEEVADQFMQGRMDTQIHTCALRSISSVIDEHGIERIDLLKIDAEKAELDILNGISDEHWPLIRQLVVEVHEQEHPTLPKVLQILEKKGFECVVEEESWLATSGLYNIYARRSNFTATASPQTKSLEDQFAALLAALDVANQRGSLITLALCPEPVENLPGGLEHYSELVERLKQATNPMNNVRVLDTSWALRSYQVPNLYDLNSDMLGHVPYSEAGYAAIATGVVRALHAVNREPYKVIVLDCDNTLWRGVVGEDGVDGLVISEPYVELQRAMKEASQQGLLLCLCSKNAEQDVQRVFDQRADMIITRDDIVAQRVNWRPKSANIQSLAEELNLGLSSFVFIDDNPVECAEVKAAHPAVLTLQLPAEDDILAFARSLWALDRFVVTQEDRQRSKQYVASRALDASRTRMSIGEFISSLNISIEHGPIDDTNIARASQMTMRTNQFNTTTMRLSEGDVRALRDKAGSICFLTRVSDRFGEYGIVGLTLAEISDGVCQVKDFLMSCRVLGRGVEYAVVNELARRALYASATTVVFDYVPSPRNQPVLDFLKNVTEHLETEDDEFSFEANKLAALSHEMDEVEYSQAEELNTKTKISQKSDMSTAEFLESVALQWCDLQALLGRLATKSMKVRDDSLGPYVEPRSETESKVTGIFRRALNLDQVSVTDHFFDAGGTSLLAVQVISRLRELSNKKLSAVALFEHTTARSIAAHIDDENNVSEQAVAQARNRGAARRAARNRRRA